MFADYYAYCMGKAGLEEGCVWSIEDEVCVHSKDPSNAAIAEHASKYTFDQIRAYYSTSRSLAIPHPYTGRCSFLSCSSNS